nr:Excitatory amino acid transporter [Hymenolepis microstoma]
MLTIIAGVIVGFAIGFGLRELPEISETLKVWISMPGDIYIRLLKLTILPLIASNVIIVIAKLDPKENGKISLISFLYILLFNILGSSIGVAAAMAIGPGVIFTCVAFGLAASGAKEKGVPFLEFFASLADVVLKLIRAFLQITPIGVCFMIAGSVIKVDDIAGSFAKLGIFVATVVVGIAVLMLIEWLFYFVCLRKNPFRPIKYLMRSWFIVFATTSAIVGVPEALEGCDEMGIRKGTSRFVAPLAATLKADGSAIFIAAACVFVAQMEGIDNNAGKIVVIWLLTCALVIAIPHIPSSSIVLILTILASVGVPVEQVSLLYATEWLLDRIRSGMSCVSTFYCVCFTDYVTRGKDDGESYSDNEFDDVISELSQAKSLKNSS